MLRKARGRRQHATYFGLLEVKFMGHHLESTFLLVPVRVEHLPE